MSIRLLEHDRDNDTETETISRKIERVVRHPKYSNSNYNSDIALMRLDEKVRKKHKLNLRTARRINLGSFLRSHFVLIFFI